MRGLFIVFDKVVVLLTRRFLNILLDQFRSLFVFCANTALISIKILLQDLGKKGRWKDLPLKIRRKGVSEQDGDNGNVPTANKDMTSYISNAVPVCFFFKVVLDLRKFVRLNLTAWFLNF